MRNHVTCTQFHTAANAYSCCVMVSYSWAQFYGQYMCNYTYKQGENYDCFEDKYVFAWTILIDDEYENDFNVVP